MADGKVSVAVIGTGDIGRGWAALCVAVGWKVTIFDTVQASLDGAPAEIAARAQGLLALDRALAYEVEDGIESLTTARSLLQACEGAQWVIESVQEDLMVKQKLFEMFESVASQAKIVTSSTSALLQKDIAARCRRKDRVFVAHPLNPPELIPLVEIVPGPQSDPSLLEVLRAWLRLLNRIPVTIRKAVPGNIAGRIAAAVWREAIDLVLTGVVDVDDLDRAVSLGPALGWAAAGPHLTYHLAAGRKGVGGFIQGLLGTFEGLWSQMPTWQKLDPAQQRQLVQAIEKTYSGQIEQLRKTRDRRLAGILKGLEQARHG